jgi:prolyl-tRNA editing enzyme YbaK/EbsC (Cys-tRNA(Pro) deacylase)
MSDLPPASLHLIEHNVPHRVFRHTGAVTSLEQAASERGQSPDQVVRSIVFRLGEGKFVMALAAGGAQISWPNLRAYLGQNRVSLASEEEVLQATGYRIGAVSPFGLPAPLRILVDESVLQSEELSLGSGERNVAIILLKGDLINALGAIEIGKFASG